MNLSSIVGRDSEKILRVNGIIKWNSPYVYLFF